MKINKEINLPETFLTGNNLNLEAKGLIFLIKNHAPQKFNLDNLTEIISDSKEKTKEIINELIAKNYVSED